MISTVFFDFDGVLVESVDIKTKAFGSLFVEEGEEVSQKIVDYHLQNIGVTRLHKLKYIYTNILGRHLTDKVFSELCNRFSNLVMEKVINVPFVPGAEEFLKQYTSRLNCYVVSATPEEELVQIVHRRNMDPYFKGVHGAPRTKKTIVQKIINESQLNVEQCVFVGDALADYDVANQTGVHFIARINVDNKLAFDPIRCIKILDLKPLFFEINRLSRD